MIRNVSATSLYDPTRATPIFFNRLQNRSTTSTVLCCIPTYNSKCDVNSFKFIFTNIFQLSLLRYFATVIVGDVSQINDGTNISFLRHYIFYFEPLTDCATLSSESEKRNRPWNTSFFFCFSIAEMLICYLYSRKKKLFRFYSIVTLGLQSRLIFRPGVFETDTLRDEHVAEHLWCRYLYLKTAYCE